MNKELVEKNQLYYKRRIRFILRKLSIHRSSILDLGCGEFTLFDELQKDVIKSYVGVDNIPFLSRKHPLITFICEDILDYGNSISTKYDVIFCLGVLDHMDKDKQERVMDVFKNRFNEFMVLSFANSVNPMINLFTSKEKPKMKLNIEREIYLLKIPKTQLVFDVSALKGMRRYIATEIIYFIKAN